MVRLAALAIPLMLVVAAAVGTPLVVLHNQHDGTDHSQVYPGATFPIVVQDQVPATDEEAQYGIQEGIIFEP